MELEDRMPEAEVALLLAFHLLDHPKSHGVADVAIDGAQVRVGKKTIFPIVDYFDFHGWKMVEQSGKNTWQGIYRQGKKSLRIHSRSGVGDVVAWIGEKRVRAECKKGNLFRRAANPEYGILREALGQILTVDEIHRQDVMVVAVPRGEGFVKLAALWCSRPLVVRSKIRIVLVGRDGSVDGLGMI